MHGHIFRVDHRNLPIFIKHHGLIIWGTNNFRDISLSDFGMTLLKIIFLQLMLFIYLVTYIR